MAIHLLFLFFLVQACCLQLQRRLESKKISPIKSSLMAGPLLWPSPFSACACNHNRQSGNGHRLEQCHTLWVTLGLPGCLCNYLNAHFRYKRESVKEMHSLVLSYLCGGVTHPSVGSYSKVNEHRFHQFACVHLCTLVEAIQKHLDCASTTPTPTPLCSVLYLSSPVKQFWLKGVVRNVSESWLPARRPALVHFRVLCWTCVRTMRYLSKKKGLGWTKLSNFTVNSTQWPNQWRSRLTLQHSFLIIYICIWKMLLSKVSYNWTKQMNLIWFVLTTFWSATQRRVHEPI